MNEIFLSGGDLGNMEQSTRVYFWAVTPTGMDVGLKKCPGMTVLSNKSREVARRGEGLGGTTFSSIYRCEHAQRIKMVVLGSNTGAPKTSYTVYIDVDETYEGIDLSTGHENFGRFQGRGRIDYGESTKTTGAGMARDVRPLTKKLLEMEFKLELTSAPLETEHKHVRKILY